MLRFLVTRVTRGCQSLADPCRVVPGAAVTLAGTTPMLALLTTSLVDSALRAPAAQAMSLANPLYLASCLAEAEADFARFGMPDDMTEAEWDEFDRLYFEELRYCERFPEYLEIQRGIYGDLPIKDVAHFEARSTFLDWHRPRKPLAA